MKHLKKMIYLALLLSVKSANALMFGYFDLSGIASTILYWFDDFYVQAVVTIFAFFALLLAILRVALARIPVFRDNERQLNVVAVVISLLSSLGIFFYSNLSFFEVIGALLQWAGIFGAVLFGVIMGMVFYYLFDGPQENGHRDWGIALVGFGVALIMAGVLMP